MPRTDAVIDLDADPLATRADRRRRLRRIGVPILGVVLMIAAIMIIALQLNHTGRRGALKLADEALAATDASIKEQVTSYFAIPSRALEEGVTIGEHESEGEGRRALIEKFSISAMKHIPQIADFIVGNSAGDFLMFRRGDNGGIDIKLIDNTPKARKVVWIRRSADAKETGREEDPTDDFDPRIRPWYSGALTTSGIFWSDVYVFYTAKKPGITASTRYTSPEGRDFVVGVDITLTNLSEFLSSLKIGESGRAMIVDGHGRVIAHPRQELVVRQDTSGPVTAHVDEIGDAAAVSAYDRFRAEGPGRQTITIGGKRYLTSLLPLETVGRDWSILMIVPEKDLIGFVDQNARTGLLMSLGVVAIAVLLAVLLIRQGLRGDRAARLARDRARALARQDAALDKLATEGDLFDPTRSHLPDALTETIADLTGARRASLWYFSPDGSSLRCADSFDREISAHTAGTEIQRRELPAFFRHLAEGTEIDATDAAGDPRCGELHRLILAPLGSRALVVFPVRRHDRVVGAIWLEDPVDTAESRHFLRVLASLAALRADDASEPAHGAEAGTHAAASEPAAARDRSVDLAARGLDQAALGQALYSDVSVMVMRLDEPGSTAGRIKDPELLDAVVRAVQELATEQDIPYLKLVGGDIVGAAGFTEGDETAATRIANTAIASRDRIAELFKSHGLSPDFRLGMDSGIAIGRSLGAEPSLFNLWGEAVQTAQTMAAASFPGTIQTSEASFNRLRHNFLFRPRGSFYLPAVGRARTFVLAGQL
jgi:adenylate cyclase